MSTVSPPRSRGRFLLLLGPVLAFLGIGAYVVQLWLDWLAVPWYMPALAFLGVALVGASLRERRTVWRVLALIALVGLGGFELMVLSAMRLPPYTGPVAVGKPFPSFEAKRADGAPFTQAGLIGEQPTAMVFFRGRW
jgi:hypothetical protein